MAIVTRSSALTGMPLLPIVSATRRALYFFATTDTFSSRSGSADVELMIGWALVIFLQPGLNPQDIGAVKTERHIDHGFNDLGHPGEDFLPVLFARAEIEIERLRAGFHLANGQILKELRVFRLAGPLSPSGK